MGISIVLTNLTDAVRVYPNGETGIRQYDRLQIAAFGSLFVLGLQGVANQNKWSPMVGMIGGYGCVDRMPVQCCHFERGRPGSSG